MSNPKWNEKSKDWWDGLMYATREVSKVALREGIEPTPACKYCQSRHVVKYGHKKNIQNWLCRDCGHKFVDNKALPGMKTATAITASAVNRFYEGHSLNAIRRGLQQDYGVYPSDSTVYEWIRRYTKALVAEADKFHPHTGDVFVADETVLKIEGKNWWFWDIIDVKTRVLLASRISATRTTRDARALVEQASKRAGKVPKVIVTDKLASYIDGIELAFGADTKHIRAKTLTSEPAKELIERFHGTLKQRTKVMRGLKSRESAELILNGWLAFYNYLRPHESLDNKTPGEKADVKFSYSNWTDLIKDTKGKITAKTESPISEPDSLELHHPKSATATLGHFAGHKVRITPQTPRISPRTEKLR